MPQVKGRLEVLAGAWAERTWFWRSGFSSLHVDVWHRKGHSCGFWGAHPLSCVNTGFLFFFTTFPCTYTWICMRATGQPNKQDADYQIWSLIIFLLQCLKNTRKYGSFCLVIPVTFCSKKMQIYSTLENLILRFIFKISHGIFYISDASWNTHIYAIYTYAYIH